MSQVCTRTDFGRQDLPTPFTIEIDSGDLGCPGQPKSIEQVIREGQEAWQRLSSGLAWADWVRVGAALQAGQIEAMRASHSNRPEGRRFNAEYGAWLKSKGFERIDKAARSRLLTCLKNRPAIEAWMASLPANKRLALNHPSAVWRAWQRTQVPKSDAPRTPSHVEKLKASIVELEEDNRRMRRDIQSGGGDLFRPEDKPKDIARVWAAMFTPSKMAAIIKEYRRLIKSESVS
jgi:hypothetical protein